MAEREVLVSARKHWESFQSLADTTMGAAIEIAWLYSLRTKNNGRLPRNRGKTVGTQAPHTANANDQIGDRNKNIGAATSQAGRSLALT
jgi:hypothetical protein